MDDLKIINDTYGHTQGDNALKTLAHALELSIRDNEYCARIGGDEFAAIIEIDYPNRSNDFKINFLKHLMELSKFIDQYDVGASIGICETTEPIAKQSLLSCIQTADQRMYEDKQYRKKSRT